MKKIITSANAPAAIGPYSQAVESNGILFVSGQIPLDPVSNEVVDREIKIQTKRALENLESILDEAGYRDRTNDGIRETPDGKDSLVFRMFYPANAPKSAYLRSSGRNRVSRRARIGV